MLSHSSSPPARNKWLTVATPRHDVANMCYVAVFVMNLSLSWIACTNWVLSHSWLAALQVMSPEQPCHLHVQQLCINRWVCQAATGLDWLLCQYCSHIGWPGSWWGVFWNYSKLFTTTTQNYSKLLTTTTQNYSKLLKTIQNYQLLLKTIQN